MPQLAYLPDPEACDARRWMKNHHLALWLVAGMALPAFAECGGTLRCEQAWVVAESRGQHGSGVARSEHDELAIHARRALEELRALAKALRKKADDASAQGRTTLEQQLRALQAEQSKLEKRLLELEAASAREWKQLQEEIDQAIQQFSPPPENARHDAI
jgi:predicted mannosyl-3-phosphoglycerate phosphatase (HAD superfamily)